MAIDISLIHTHASCPVVKIIYEKGPLLERFSGEMDRINVDHGRPLDKERF
jgi:hypothetical protein